MALKASMRKWRLLPLLGLLMAAAWGQDTPRVEAYGGPAYVRVNPATGAGDDFHGWNTAVEGDVSQHLGLKADFAGVYGNQGPANLHLYTFLAGPDLRHRESASPFFHVLAGAARLEANAFSQRVTQTKFAFDVGGGVDFPIRSHLAARAFQLDYLLTRFGSNNQHGLRLSFGLVVQMGGKK